MTDMIKENWKQGNFTKERKKSMDNYALLPNYNRLQRKPTSEKEQVKRQTSHYQTASARMMSGKRQDIVSKSMIGKMTKQCEPIQEKGYEESMEDG